MSSLVSGALWHRHAVSLKEAVLANRHWSLASTATDIPLVTELYSTLLQLFGGPPLASREFNVLLSQKAAAQQTGRGGVAVLVAMSK